MIATANSTIGQRGPTPLGGESYEHYVIRAHRELANLVTDPETRNQIIWDTWRQSRGSTLAEMQAAKTFDSTRFSAKPNVCVFGEHQATDSQGQKRNYDLREMVKIARNCNERIADVGAFAALSDGHTPNPDDSDQAEPRVMGYAGPYRLGMIGRVKPRWAIFADEHHIKEYAGELASKPRRSVELWTFKNEGKSHFDPIAALGAEAPRLALPSRFSILNRHGATCERYSCSAPAYPGGGPNTFVKGGRDRKHYSNHEGSQMDTLSPDALAQITSALGETPQFKFLTLLMNSPSAKQLLQGGGGESNGNGQYGAEEDDEEENVDYGALPTGQNRAMWAQVDENEEGRRAKGKGYSKGRMKGNWHSSYEADDESEDADNMGKTSPDDDDLSDLSDLLPPEEEDKNMGPLLAAGIGGVAGGLAGKKGAKQNGELVHKYNALSAAHTKLVQRFGHVNQSVKAMLRENVDNKRQLRLEQLAKQHPGFVDVGEESTVCLYSAGSHMTDSDFDKHCETITRYAARAEPLGARRLPVGEMPPFQGSSLEMQKYEAALADEAVKICTQSADAGVMIDYDEAESKAQDALAKRGINAPRQ